MYRELADSLNRAWRIAGTGLSFTVLGLGAIFLGVIVCPVMRVMIHDPQAYAQAARRLVSRSFRHFADFMAMVGVIRWSVEGMEHWQRDRPFLIIANHPTLIDVVFLLALFEGADCIVKADVLRNPCWGFLVRGAEYLSNEDMGLLLSEAASRLRSGRTVIMFPEGTRTVPGQPRAFGAAAGAIAVRAGCACLPVVITCAPPTLYKGLPWYEVPARRPQFRLRVCPAIPAPDSTAAGQRQAARAHNDTISRFFERELGAIEGPELDPEHEPASGQPV